MTLLAPHDETPLDAAPDTVLLGDREVREAVAMHAAITLLPPTASVSQRERVRANWYSALNVAHVEGYEEWALAYVPGVHVGDGDVHAVYRPTGHVFGGDVGPTVQAPGESSRDWLDRLTANLDGLVAAYQPRYQPHLHA